MFYLLAVMHLSITHTKCVLLAYTTFPYTYKMLPGRSDFPYTKCCQQLDSWAMLVGNQVLLYLPCVQCNGNGMKSTLYICALE
jgi:hypothetical protein